ncbi:CLUMA_CG007080, isoform A [Clunio marinus]|uniref:CLUMA_CG007080, isoform A n=1 Tax=Clunio marinus TaxID=568069 RepID=A0A1J1I009_9DIPT|nr:CLUMA_CG007080, isoform A [Clunio marinus]
MKVILKFFIRKFKLRNENGLNLLFITILICVIFRGVSCQNSRSNRKKGNGKNVQKSFGIDNQRTSQDHNYGLSPRRSGHGQRKRVKSSQQRQHDHEDSEIIKNLSELMYQLTHDFKERLQRSKL